MRNLLLKAWPKTGRARVRLNDAYAGFIGPDDFAGMLALERKRVERSRGWILLMLLDLRAGLEGPSGEKLLSGVQSALSSSTRETDIKGWYNHGAVIGIIFTETGSGAKAAVSTAVLARITHVLAERLADDASKRISISLSYFPEERDPERPECFIDGQLYPDLFERPNSKKVARLFKRAIDIVISILALITLSPLFGFIACLIKLTSDGPVLFRQQRVGERGRHFEFLKFRSMYVQNDPAVHQEYVRKFIRGGAGLKPANGNRVYKITQDARVTPLGKFLRKSSLDEVPQLWNVLKGEMSLVGPRPPIPYEFECYALWHRRRVVETRPGITGLWQVNGRSRTTFDEMVRLDLQYARNWSLWLDFKILVQTTRAVVSREGAY